MKNFLNNKSKIKSNKIAKQGGFTLVEMLVSITIFVLVAFTITSTLITVSNANRKTQELKQIMDNLNFSVQSMVLRMREGNFYKCLDSGASRSPTQNVLVGGVGDSYNCPNGNNSIVFLDPTNGTVVSYYLADGGNNGKILKSTRDGDVLQITSEEVGITDLTFYVSGMTNDNTRNPAVTIIIRGVAKLRSGEATSFTLQTFVTTHAYAP